ncbi:DsbA family protein [Streptomyces tirandamycinicus]|uniref:DsbA family protein n=1 Tax=Streptomyces tirandamycinicus TaxID=2174846 RepID=A0A2S1SNM2_9ACTN|nr:MULTISPECIES: DsbA family protein [Streptomyces]AWI27971.1 DsbA family protein [Streptomyces tirandamycinicus]MCY0981650.1 DsbA family protein [Streptomyces tirandamycinicus]NNJ05161.1 DsbA family protein [Streptomyces sp. PKU-MA01144]TFE56753.1 DsbA family protein [Streptomyces sp. ICN441]
MSARNSRANKAAARERLRLERERQAKKDKIRRQIVVAVSTVAVLAAAGGIGYAVMQANKPSAWEAAKDAKVVQPKNTEGENGTTVVIGKPAAKKTLEVYEDSRCPVCATFEQAVGETMKKDVDAGKYKLKYVGATFIDKTDNGEGSKNALSALGAALDVSPEAFMDFKAALYSANFHPEESDDKFAKDAYLLEIADSVDALKNNAAFKKNVEDGTFDSWALKMSETFDDSGVTGTPTLRMDGKKVVAEGSENAPMTVEQFNAAVDKALKG